MELDLNIFKIEYNKVAPKKGRILVSEPFLQDTYFKRSIVLLTEHSNDGSVGFVINKPLDVKVSEVINDFPDNSINLSIGGPVSTNTVHYVHTLGHYIPNSAHITGNLFWGGDFGFIKEMLQEGKLPKEQIRFFLGYAGWQPGQLENELEQNSWLISEIGQHEIFTPGSNLWKASMSNMGEKYKIWSDFPENPGLN
jgi:putative transcriptional regulator